MKKEFKKVESELKVTASEELEKSVAEDLRRDDKVLAAILKKRNNDEDGVPSQSGVNNGN